MTLCLFLCAVCRGFCALLSVQIAGIIRTDSRPREKLHVVTCNFFRDLWFIQTWYNQCHNKIKMKWYIIVKKYYFSRRCFL